MHNIKEDNRDYIKIYDIVFYPHPSDSCSQCLFPSEQTQAVIIKRFKINNLLVPKKKEIR